MCTQKLRLQKKTAANFHPSGCIKGLLVFDLFILLILNLAEHFMLLKLLLKIFI